MKPGRSSLTRPRLELGRARRWSRDGSVVDRTWRMRDIEVGHRLGLKDPEHVDPPTLQLFLCRQDVQDLALEKQAIEDIEGDAGDDDHLMTLSRKRTG